MKIGIIYFSKTGNTQKIAELLAGKLREMEISADVIEIKSPKVPGMLRGGQAALKQKKMPISNESKDLGGYDMFLFGSPIWAWRPVPYIKSFLNIAENVTNKAAGIFFTCAGDVSKHPKAVPMLTEQLSQFDIEVKSFISLQMSKGNIVYGQDKIEDFIRTVVV